MSICGFFLCCGLFLFFFFLMIRRPPRSTLFPYTTLSDLREVADAVRRPTRESRGVALDTKQEGDRKSGSAGMPRPISYAVFCLKKKKDDDDRNTTPSRGLCHACAPPAPAASRSRGLNERPPCPARAAGAHATKFAVFFFFNDTATTEIYTLSLHDALPIYAGAPTAVDHHVGGLEIAMDDALLMEDRKSGSAGMPRPISYAVFCLKKQHRRRRPPVATARRTPPATAPSPQRIPRPRAPPLPGPALSCRLFRSSTARQPAARACPAGAAASRRPRPGWRASRA